jgi:hypothetical protein
MCFTILHHVTSNVLVQIVDISLEKDNRTHFLYQRYARFFQKESINGYTPSERRISSLKLDIFEQSIQLRYGLVE